MNSGGHTIEFAHHGALVDAINASGFAIVPECLSIPEIEILRTKFPESTSPQRNILAHEAVRRLASSPSIRRLVTPILGKSCFAVRAIFFNKTSDANWKVSWHQDLTIALREKRDAPGFASWSVKSGTTHVQPPAKLLEQMLAVRVHLDGCDAENGPLRCVPGSHKSGRLSTDEIRMLEKSHAVSCLAPAGSALLMRPLVVHASSSCISVRPRRVVHLEFANAELPGDLKWNERV